MMDEGASVGTLVGAALETLGHYMQSKILDFLTLDALAMDFGVLLYLISLVAALIIVAVGGQYKWGLWFVMGPPIFFWMLYARVPSDGVYWQFGEKVHSSSMVFKAASNSAEIDTPRVSLFFNIFNRFSSGVVQVFVSVLGGGGNNRFSEEFIKKVQRYYMLKLPRLKDGYLKGFFETAFSNNCKQYFLLQRAVNDRIKYNDVTRRTYAKKLDEIRSLPVWT